MVPAPPAQMLLPPLALVRDKTHSVASESQGLAESRRSGERAGGPSETSCRGCLKPGGQSGMACLISRKGYPPTRARARLWSTYGGRVHVTVYVEVQLAMLTSDVRERVSTPFAELPSLAKVMLVVAVKPPSTPQSVSFAVHPVSEML